MTRSGFILKWTAYGIALCLVLVFNYYVLALLPLGAVPQLIPIVVMAVGLLEGSRGGAGFGIAAGLVLAASVHASVCWVAILSLCGWVCGLLAQYALRRDVVGFFPVVLAAEGIFCACKVLFHWVSGTAAPWVLLQVALPEYLWTVAFAGPVYALCRFCCRCFGRIYYE